MDVAFTGTNKEIVTVEADRSRFVPILLAVVVHELAGIVRFMPYILHPWYGPLVV